MQFSQQFSNILTTIINILVIPLLPIFTNYLVTFIKKKTSEIEINVKNKELIKYIDIAERGVLMAVAAVNQTYVDSLKKQNGSLTEYEKKVAFVMAKEKTLTIIGETAVSALNLLYKDFGAWLESKIEYQVNRLKSPITLQTIAPPIIQDTFESAKVVRN